MKAALEPTPKKLDKSHESQDTDERPSLKKSRSLISVRNKTYHEKFLRKLILEEDGQEEYRRSPRHLEVEKLKPPLLSAKNQLRRLQTTNHFSFSSAANNADPAGS